MAYAHKQNTSPQNHADTYFAMQLLHSGSHSTPETTFPYRDYSIDGVRFRVWLDQSREVMVGLVVAGEVTELNIVHANGCRAFSDQNTGLSVLITPLNDNRFSIHAEVAAET